MSKASSRHRSRASALLPALALLGSSSAALSQTQGHVREDATPPPNTRQTAYLGGVIWRSEAATVRTGARILAPVELHLPLMAPLRVAAYAPLTSVSSKAKLKVCADNGDGACLLDDDGDGTFDRIAQDLGSRAYKLKSPAPYERVSVAEPGTKIVREVTVLGISPTSVTFKYHDEAEAAPGASVEDRYEFPLTGRYPLAVTMRTLRIAIEAVGDGKIEYTVLP